MNIGAIEAGGTKFVCGIGNEHGEIFEKISIPTRNPVETIKDVIAFFDGKEIDRMGIGSFGPIQVNRDQSDYGTILETPKTAWKYFPLLQTIKSYFPKDMPFEVDTDVNAAAFGELKWGAAKGLDSCVYFTVGTGIGAGAVIDGKIVHGLLHPEAGHMFVKRHPKDDFVGSCPYHGDCLEGLAAGTSMKERWGKAGVDIHNEEAWEMEAYYLAQTAINALLTYSPEKIIFGGGVLNHPGLIEKVREQFSKLLNGYIKKDEVIKNVENYIVLPGLGSEAGLKGSLALVL
ncbi:fructokinase [Virgibacillus profundi]|uniref:fructokinase n=1 Tax=Virgibacillus profundi TaxID=2024555 RepID=A0A2A2IFP2_9BACI|nr:ROK family protein [Virgibacillus profundi]PAV30821.1 fructokinase [Virgibacillus profundi]PXY55004.1 fructokinase [Virgibacillus profundi]